jgi:type IV pilus assembly protein PilM
MFSCFGKGLIGIDIDDNMIRVAVVSKKYGGYKLCKFGYCNVPHGSLKNGMIIDMKGVSILLKNLLKTLNIKRIKAATSICSSNMFIKKVTLRDITESGIDQIYLYEASHHLPFDIGDMTVDYHILEKKGSTFKLLFTAIKNELIENRVSVLKMADLKPQLIEPDLFSIINLFNICHKKSGLVLKVDHTKSSIVLPYSKDPYIKNLPYGSDHLKKDESKFVRIISSELFESAKRCDNLNKRVFIIGEKVPSALIDVLKLGVKSVEYFKPYEKIVFPEKYMKYSSQTPVTLGLAMSRAGGK